jgi:glycosyltransferase involved in cell wall biosynthesis
MKNKKNTKRIGIDARFYGPLGKGLGRYVQEITENVIMIDENCQYEFVIFLSKNNYDEFSPHNFKNRQVKKVLADVSWYGFKEQFIFPFIIAKEKLDLIHFPHFNVPIFSFCPFVLTIHDLILTKFPSKRASTLTSFKYWFKHLMYRLVIKSALIRAKEIIAVSNFTKNDIINRFKIKEAKIKVVYEGVANLEKGRDSLFVAKLDKEETLMNYNISGPYLLYVGNAYPHKNLNFLLNSFVVLNKEYNNFRLVLVGKEDYFYRQVKKEAIKLNLWQKVNKNSLVIFTDYVPDAQLKILYNQAFAYVFPSLYEGFGLPPLEAMANSCPVISSNKASLPEILDEAALYFNPKDLHNFIDTFKKLIDNDDLREKQINLGKERVKNFNWWESARETLNIYSHNLKDK